MRRAILAAALVLACGGARADMFQDASNAVEPAARQNLRLGTIKSEGGTPPTSQDALTRFYTYDGSKQFEVASHPASNEFAIEQAGLGAPGGVGVGQGATRVCWAPYSNHQVNCNYAAFGRSGQHNFGNGAGTLAQMLYQGTGSITAWPKFTASDDGVARIGVGGSGGLELSGGTIDLTAAGFGGTTISNGQGTLAFVGNGTVGPTDAWLQLLGSNDGYARLLASGPGANVRLIAFAKGNSQVFLGNGFGSAAEFVSSASPTGGYFVFTAGGGVATVENSAGGGIYVKNSRAFVHQALGTYLVTSADSGTHFTNVGAVGASTAQLPAATQGLNYCFFVDAAQSVTVQADGTDRIAISTNSGAGGTISASAQFASVCIESHEAGQWVTSATPDKTQWTVSP